MKVKQLTNPEISVVSPVYMAESIIDTLVERIIESVLKVTDNFEIILVEDGSTDHSWEVIEKNSCKDKRVKGVKFSRNFGQHFAITAGLVESRGNYIVVIDCDLQDNPKYIPDLYKKISEDYDIVYTSKSKREHSFFKNITAQWYNRIFNYLTDGSPSSKDIGAYSILNRRTADAFCSIKDTHRHYLMVLRLLGFRSTIIQISHDKRYMGKGSYSFPKLISHAIDGITSQSDKLLYISVSLGFIIFLLALAGVVTLIVLYFIRGTLPGYTSLMVVILLSTGTLLMSLGILGIYLGKIFDQVKGRPLYFIEKKLNL